MMAATRDLQFTSYQTPTGSGHDEELLGAPAHHVASSSPAASLELGINDVLRELQSLEALEDDWDGEGAAEIDPASIDRARSFVKTLATFISSRGYPWHSPSVAPTPEGGVSLTWHLPGATFWLVVRPDISEFTFLNKRHQREAQRRQLHPLDALRATLIGLGAL